MKGILGKPWFDMEPWIDIKALADRELEIAAGLAAANGSRWPSIVGAQGNLWDPSKVELGDYVQAHRAAEASSYKAILDRLPPGPVSNQFFRYLNLDLVDLNDAIHIYAPSSYETKHLASSRRATAAAEHFGWLARWADNQSIFEQWGRMVFFITESGKTSVRHRDYPDGLSRKDQFIWIDLSGRKQFYVWDDTANTTHMITSRAALFDNSDWHGADQAQGLAWSLRIDGVFSKDFLAASGLDRWISSN